MYQLVFGSRYYTPFLTSKNQDILYSYIVGILKNKSCHSYIIGGICNHIHIVTHIHPSICLANLIKDMKEATHVFMCREKALFFNFPGWHLGYGGFTYHISSKESLIKYVQNQ